MAYTQTILATLAVLISVILTLGLNEGVYNETDLNIRLDGATYGFDDSPQDCRFLDSALAKTTYSVDDDIAREFLYGVFSARGAAISAIVLSLAAFVIAVVAPDLDFDLGAAKYKDGSWFHEGDTKAFVAGVLFRLVVAGALLSMSISTLCSMGALSHQGYVPGIGLDFGVDGLNPRLLPEECKGDEIGNVIHRSDSLKSSVFFSVLSVFAIGFMAYAVKYDKKASASPTKIF